MREFKFIKRVEQLVKPIDIATLQLLARMNKFIPKQLQNKMMNSSAKSNPYMGFVVEPYMQKPSVIRNPQSFLYSQKKM